MFSSQPLFQLLHSSRGLRCLSEPGRIVSTSTLWVAIRWLECFVLMLMFVLYNNAASCLLNMFKNRSLCTDAGEELLDSVKANGFLVHICY